MWRMQHNLPLFCQRLNFSFLCFFVTCTASFATGPVSCPQASKKKHSEVGCFFKHLLLQTLPGHIWSVIKDFRLFSQFLPFGSHDTAGVREVWTVWKAELRVNEAARTGDESRRLHPRMFFRSLRRRPRKYIREHVFLTGEGGKMSFIVFRKH